MNPTAILALISDLYAQIGAQGEHIKTLEAVLTEKETADLRATESAEREANIAFAAATEARSRGI